LSNIKCCGQFQRASKTRLPGDYGYEYIYLYERRKCGECGKRVMEWNGQYLNGRFSTPVQIEPEDFNSWTHKRKTEKVTPEIRIMSEFSGKIAAPADSTMAYLDKIAKAIQSSEPQLPLTRKHIQYVGSNDYPYIRA
jgi:hypothetical protein